jgi:hypothetical protein
MWNVVLLKCDAPVSRLSCMFLIGDARSLLSGLWFVISAKVRLEVLFSTCRRLVELVPGLRDRCCCGRGCRVFGWFGTTGAARAGLSLAPSVMRRANLGMFKDESRRILIASTA